MFSRRLSLALPLLFLVPGAALAQTATPFQTITATATGPLTSIFVGVEGSLQIAHILDAAAFQVYPPSSRPGDYGTMISVDGFIYGPDFQAHEDGSATGSMSEETNYRRYVPGTQTGVLGAGTPLDPFQVMTVYTATTVSLELTELTTYVVGQESFLTTVQITNTGTAARSGYIYRAADCYLGGSDSGFGFYDGASGAIACSENPDNVPQGRIEQWLPITPGSHYLQDGYNTVWTTIAAAAGQLPDTCQCGNQIDNGAGLSWAFTVAPGASTTRSHLTTFSVVGNVPITTMKVADTATVTAGATTGYTLYFDNPNIFAVTLTDVVDDLPAGFTYVPGSSTGLWATDPTITGNVLDWNGPATIAGQTTGMMHFEVLVGTSTGTFFNSAGGAAQGGITVAPTGPTAPVYVVSPSPTDAGVVPDATASPDAGGVVVDGGTPSGDGGLVEDTGVVPNPDSGVAPNPDSGVVPNPDSGVAPTSDAGTTPSLDASTGSPDASGSGGTRNDDGEGCSCSTTDAGRPSHALYGALALALMVGLVRRRRR